MSEIKMTNMIHSKLHFKILLCKRSFLNSHDASIIDEDINLLERSFFKFFDTIFN